MKLLALIFAILSGASCVRFTGNGYSATYVMTDTRAYSQTADQVITTGMTQSTVPVELINSAEGFGYAAIAGKVANAISDNRTSVDLAKETTSRVGIRTDAATEQLRIQERTKALIIRQTKPEPPVINPLTP